MEDLQPAAGSMPHIVLLVAAITPGNGGYEAVLNSLSAKGIDLDQ